MCIYATSCNIQLVTTTRVRVEVTVEHHKYSLMTDRTNYKKVEIFKR